MNYGGVHLGACLVKMCVDGCLRCRGDEGQHSIINGLEKKKMLTYVKTAEMSVEVEETFDLRLLKENKVSGDDTLTVNHNLAVRAVIVDLLDVAKVDVAEKDAVGALPSTAVVVEGEGDDVLHVVGVLEGLDWRVEVGLVRQVDAL